MKETDQSTQSSCRRKSSLANGGGLQSATEAPAQVVSPFTSGQWAELEHQALIFKYMMAGLNVPEELLNPIRRSVASALINGMSTATQHTAANLQAHRQTSVLDRPPYLRKPHANLLDKFFI